MDFVAGRFVASRLVGDRFKLRAAAGLETLCRRELPPLTRVARTGLDVVAASDTS